MICSATVCAYDPGVMVHLDDDAPGPVTKDELTDSLTLAATKVCKIADDPAHHDQADAFKLCQEWKTLSRSAPQRDKQRSLKKRMDELLKINGIA